MRQPEESPDVVVRRMLLQRAAVSPLTTRWVADFLAVGLQEARDLLTRLQDERVIRKVGAGRGTRYVLTSGPARTPVVDRDPVRDPVVLDQVVQAAGYRPMTRERVHQLLGVPLGKATEILQQLTRAGRLVSRGAGRGTSYMPAPSRPAVHRQSSFGTADADADADLESALHDLVDRIEAEGQVKSPVLRQLIDEQGAVDALNTVIRSGGPAYGFVELWKAKRLDLTVEAFVAARPELHARLEPAVVARARSRLDEFSSTTSGGSELSTGPLLTSGPQWVQMRGAGGGAGSVGWVLRRQQWAEPWPHSELGRGFTFLVADRRRDGLFVSAEVTVTAYLPFVEVSSLRQARRLAEHILAPAGLTYAAWQDVPYNQRRTTAGKWPLHFSCWAVRERPVSPHQIRPADDGDRTRTGWFRGSALR